jgi:quercetin dioxygenase-like cupin family protein
MDTPYLYIPDLLEQLPEIPPDSIISRTYYSDGSVKAILFGFAPGQELSEHTASRPAVLHFLKGEALLSLGGNTHPVAPGAWVHMPAQLPHSVKAETPLIMLLYLLESSSA